MVTQCTPASMGVLRCSRACKASFVAQLQMCLWFDSMKIESSSRYLNRMLSCMYDTTPQPSQSLL
jgi:hypothetical protein